MGKFVKLFFLLLVVKSAVSADVKSELIYTAPASNLSGQTYDEVNPRINFWEDPSSPHYGMNDKDENQENESTRSVVAQTIEAILSDPDVISELLEPETLAEVPSLLITFKRKLIHGIFRKLGIRHRFLGDNKLSAPGQKFNSGFRNHLIKKRNMGVMSSYLKDLSQKVKSQGRNILLMELKILKHILQTEKNIVHGLLKRRQKRSIIPDVVFNYFSSFLHSEPAKDEAIESESSTPEPIALKCLQERLEEILHPQLGDYPTVTDQINNLVAIEDEKLKSTIRNAIKTDESDRRTIMDNFNIPQMKSDEIYVQRLKGSVADNMAAFLKGFETDDFQNFDYKLLQPEILKEKIGNEEKHDGEDYHPASDEEEKKEDEEEEEEDDA